MTTINVASLSAPGKTGGLASESGEAVDGVAAIFDAILSAISDWDQLSGEEGVSTSQDSGPDGEHPNAEQVLAKVISDDSVKPYLNEQTSQDLLPLLENILTLPEPKEAMLDWASRMASEQLITHPDTPKVAPASLTETVMMKPLSGRNAEDHHHPGKTHDLILQTPGNHKSTPQKMKNGYGEARHSVHILASLMRKTMPALDHAPDSAPVADTHNAISASPLNSASLPNAIYGPHPQQDLIAGMSVRANHTTNSSAPELSAEHLYGPFEQHSPMAKLTSQAMQTLMPSQIPAKMPAPTEEVTKNAPLTPTAASALGNDGDTQDALKPLIEKPVNAEKEMPEKADPVMALNKKHKPNANSDDLTIPQRQWRTKTSEPLPSVPAVPSQTKAELMETRISQIAGSNLAPSGTMSGASMSGGASTEQGGHFGQQAGHQPGNQQGHQQGQNGNPGADLDTRMGLDQGKDGRLLRLNMQQQNWPDRLIRNMQSAATGNGDESIEVILEPKRLGRLVLKISMTGNVSSVSITSTSVEAASMLADPENRLQQIFEQHGIKLGQMNTSSWQGAQHGHQGNSGNPSGGKDHTPDQEQSGQKDSVDDPSTKTLENANNSQINILA